MKRPEFNEAMVGYEPHRARATLRSNGLTVKWEEDGDGGPGGFAVVRREDGARVRELWLDHELTAYLQGVYDAAPSRINGGTDG